MDVEGLGAEVLTFSPSMWTDVEGASVPVVFNNDEYMVSFDLLDNSQINALITRVRNVPEDLRLGEFTRLRLAQSIKAVNGVPLEDLLPVPKNNPTALLKGKELWSEAWKHPLTDALSRAYKDYADSFLEELEQMENDPFTGALRGDDGM